MLFRNKKRLQLFSCSLSGIVEIVYVFVVLVFRYRFQQLCFSKDGLCCVHFLIHVSVFN